ncbi:MAG TPA: hypothetical protein VFG00_14075 [Acidothermaceae bacterium]|nr:hypothetical protein [Acidothermaceae bacterium]
MKRQKTDAVWVPISWSVAAEDVERLQSQILASWFIYGEVHLTNADGGTLLDPPGITYRRTGKEWTVGEHV